MPPAAPDDPGAVARVARECLDVLLPRRCPGCGAADRAVCPACARRLVSGPVLRGVLADGTEHRASTAYGPVVRRLVLSAKEGRRADVREVLAAALARAAVEAGWSDARSSSRLLVTAPPSGARSRLRRGGDPVADLAARCTGLLRAAGSDVVATSLLRRRRPVGDQAGRDASARWDNVAGAYEARRLPTVSGGCPVDVVVVDDVITTGATASECVRVLTAAGWPVVGVAAVAVARR